MHRFAAIAFLIALAAPRLAAGSATPALPPTPTTPPAFPAPSPRTAGVPSLSVSPYT
ncbi:MAG TPA: hypothetical protein VLV15_04200 [Dongiaceae bacterium]|nr:hypothetical protein [Dongiaceae bacterium]